MRIISITKTICRILLQAMVPVMFMEFCLFMIVRTGTDSTLEQCVNTLSEAHIITAGSILAGSVILFGCWFHFISRHRFRNRRPKGLYKEYTKWFLDDIE